MDLQYPSDWSCSGTLIGTVLNESCSVSAVETYHTDVVSTTTLKGFLPDTSPFADVAFGNGVIIISFLIIVPFIRLVSHECDTIPA